MYRAHKRLAKIDHARHALLEHASNVHAEVTLGTSFCPPWIIGFIAIVVRVLLASYSPLRSANGHPSTAICVAEVWVPRSCRRDLDLHTAPHHAGAQPQPRGDERRRLPRFPAPSPLLCVHVSILKSSVCRHPRSLAAAFVSDAVLAMALLEQHALVPPPSPPTPGSWPFEVTRLRKTCHPWYALSLAAHDEHHPCWYTCCSKPRPTTSTQASLARLHERARPLPPVEERPEQFLPHMARSSSKALTRWP